MDFKRWKETRATNPPRLLRWLWMRQRRQVAAK
jgi:hypothetical protein